MPDVWNKMFSMTSPIYCQWMSSYSQFVASLWLSDCCHIRWWRYFKKMPEFATFMLFAKLSHICMCVTLAAHLFSVYTLRHCHNLTPSSAVSQESLSTVCGRDGGRGLWITMNICVNTNPALKLLSYFAHVMVICGFTLFSTLTGSRSMSSPFMHNLLYVTVAVREQAQGTSHRISSAYQVGFFKRLLTNSLLLASFLLILSPSLVYIYLCMWKCVCRNDVGICILMCYFNQIVKHFETLFWKVRYKVITNISYGHPTKQWKEMCIY